MAPYFKALGPASRVAVERYFLAADFTSGIGYGAQGALYIICTRYLWAQRKARCINKFILAYTTLLFLISTVVQVALAHRTQLMFIEHRDFPGGPWEYYEASYSATSTIVSATMGMVLLFMSELFMVWRCWVVWYSVSRRAAYIAAFFPALMLATSLPTAVLCSLMMHPDSSIAGVHTTMWIISWYTLMLSTNVLATGLILARLIMHRRAVRYSSLISMFIESAALYSIVGIGYLIVTGVRSPLREPFVGAIVSMQQMSGYLIVTRLAYGRGWQTDTMSVPSKIVIVGNISVLDAQADNEEEVLGNLKASGTAQ
ncbi:hypothetical protein BD779DRAFT_1438641 [Infundibulicybe gibba]|nr:hypothetical protein BD779DRAFT_1438641 [Infundibulicybe gibba]